MNRFRSPRLRHRLPLLAVLAWLFQVSLPGLAGAPAFESRAPEAVAAIGWCGGVVRTAESSAAAIAPDESPCPMACCVAGVGTPPVPIVPTVTITGAARDMPPSAAAAPGPFAVWSGPARVRGPPAADA